MAFGKRILLFLAVNFLVVAVISFLLYLFNLQPFLSRYHLNIPSLAMFCLIWGMGGAFISLGLSRVMAKWMMGVKLIDPNTDDQGAREVLDMVHRLAKKAGLPAMPEVGIYSSPEVNAFATGPSRKRSLVAVSSGLLLRLKEHEVEAVIGHEVTHIANGDMVTMTLLQGIINAFVMFLARLLGFVITRVLAGRGDGRDRGEISPFAYQMIVFGLEICFMILGSMVVASFGRYREFRADAGGARLAGRDKMIAALEALQRMVAIKDDAKAQPAIQALKISSPGGFLKLFATHPPLEERIARLKRLRA